jgi:hypothetical protein
VSFRTCSLCQREWPTRVDFELDPELPVLGIVVHFGDPYRGLVLFNHRCGTTIAIAVADFRDELPPLAGELHTGQEGCPGHCLRFADLEACDQPCRNAPLRRFVHSLAAAKERAQGH